MPKKEKKTNRKNIDSESKYSPEITKIVKDTSKENSEMTKVGKIWKPIDTKNSELKKSWTARTAFSIFNNPFGC